MNKFLLYFITILLTSTSAIKIEPTETPLERPLKRSVFNYYGDSNGTTILGIFLLVIGIFADIILFLMILNLLFRKRVTEDDLNSFNNVNAASKYKKLKEN